MIESLEEEYFLACIVRSRTDFYVSLTRETGRTAVRDAFVTWHVPNVAGEPGQSRRYAVLPEARPFEDY